MGEGLGGKVLEIINFYVVQTHSDGLKGGRLGWGGGGEMDENDTTRESNHHLINTYQLPHPHPAH